MRARTITTMGLLAIAAIAAYLHVEHPDLLSALAREDGVIEYTQAALYLAAAACFALGLARSRFRNLWYLAYALLFFAIAGEEISWGQRLLGIETPESYAEVNRQGETSLHNLEGVHGSIRAVGLLVVIGISFVIPAAYRWVAPVRRLIQRWRHPVFPMWAGVATILGLLFMVVPRLTIGVNFELDEIGEFYLAAAMFIFGLTAVDGRNPEPVSLEEDEREPRSDVGSVASTPRS